MRKILLLAAVLVGAFVLWPSPPVQRPIPETPPAADAAHVARPAPLPPLTIGGAAPLVDPEPVPPEFVEALTDATSGMGPDAHKRYEEWLATIHTDRAVAADRLNRTFTALDAEARDRRQGRALVFAMGQAAHASSLDTLAEHVGAPLPEPDLHAHHVDQRGEAIITRSIALRSMEQIVDRYRQPAQIRIYREVLDQLVDDPEAPQHLVVRAAMQLRKYAKDPETMADELAERLGERAFLARVTPVVSLPDVDPEAAIKSERSPK